MFQNFLTTTDVSSVRRRSLTVLDRGQFEGESRTWDKALQRDLQTLARFICVFCKCKHSSIAKQPVETIGIDVSAIAGKGIRLCPSCTKLLAHAFVKRSRCPMDPKPQCKKCPNHCYHHAYREQMRKVMQFSGARLLLMGRLDYLFHFLF